MQQPLPFFEIKSEVKGVITRLDPVVKPQLLMPLMRVLVLLDSAERYLEGIADVGRTYR